MKAPLLLTLGVCLSILAGALVHAQRGGTVKLPDLLPQPAPAPQPGAQPGPQPVPQPTAPARPAVQAAPATTQKFSDAMYVTRQQFLRQLRDVSVLIRAPRTTTRYVPEAELLADVRDALSAYNIAVRPDSQVRLEVLVTENVTPFVFNDDKSDTQDVHDVLVRLAFMTKGVVRRNGRLVSVISAPVVGSYIATVFQDNSTRRLFFGDATEKYMKDTLPNLVKGALEEIAGSNVVDPTPWYAATWTDAQQAAANAQFDAVMRAAPTDHLAGLSVMPSFDTVSGGAITNGCDTKMPAIVVDHWREKFRAMGWTQTSTETPLQFQHSFVCDPLDYLNAPEYSRVWNSVELREPNFVFVLNGRLVRKPAVVAFWDHLVALDSDEPISKAIDYMIEEMDDDFLELPKAPGAR